MDIRKNVACAFLPLLLLALVGFFAPESFVGSIFSGVLLDIALIAVSLLVFLLPILVTLVTGAYSYRKQRSEQALNNFGCALLASASMLIFMVSVPFTLQVSAGIAMSLLFYFRNQVDWRDEIGVFLVMMFLGGVVNYVIIGDHLTRDDQALFRAGYQVNADEDLRKEADERMVEIVKRSNFGQARKSDLLLMAEAEKEHTSFKRNGVDFYNDLEATGFEIECVGPDHLMVWKITGPASRSSVSGGYGGYKDLKDALGKRFCVLQYERDNG